MSPSYIGIDAHVKFCQCCVINGKGEEKLNVAVKTEPERLIEFIRSIRGPRYAITEMSSMAEWLVRTLSLPGAMDKRSLSVPGCAFLPGCYWSIPVCATQGIGSISSGTFLCPTYQLALDHLHSTGFFTNPLLTGLLWI